MWLAFADERTVSTNPLCDVGAACRIDKVLRGWEQPSDHTPVIAEFVVS